METNLDALPLKELKEIEKALPKAIAKKEKEMKNEVKQQLIAKAEAEGFSIEELFGSKKSNSKPKGKVAMRYQNPNNKDQQWSGRGNSPKWVKEFEANGGNRDDLLIDK